MMGCKPPQARPPPLWDSSAAMDWFGFSQKTTLLQSFDFGSNSMGWKPPPPGGPPLWFSFAKQGFYEFKPSICALCCSNTHEILQCPERKYFPDYVKEHINMRNGSQRCWDDPTFDYYAPNLNKHPNFIWAGTHQPFEQPNVPQSSEDGSATSTFECVKSYDNKLNDEIKEPPTGDSCQKGATAPDDLEISSKSIPTQVHTPHILFHDAAKQPTKLH
ncbi:hypothetical protein DVH24_025839 [Malus domestica]|uniref:Uncharacterized protein n=1 Tax=Malus domestica TaxID=3750 RepID=A0A498KN21_MALDO|nr:hypothetical protein DVH24_025839 [Malus domestica]